MLRGKIMKIVSLKTEHLTKQVVTDEIHPRFSFSLQSENRGVRLVKAKISCNGWEKETDEQILIPYEGKPLQPNSEYTVTVFAEDNFGETDEAQMTFRTAKLNTPWLAKWITDGQYRFTEKRVSPVPMTFRRTLNLTRPVKRATVYATAMGIYNLYVNDRRVGKNYFAPGFTSYQTTLQYQTYDVTDLLSEHSTLCAVVAGGWAVGSFVFTRVNRVSADRQALLMEIRIEYEDGSTETIGTDETWQVSTEGKFRMVDLYDGETYDATVSYDAIPWHQAAEESLRVNPKIVADFGSPVTAHETFQPVSVVKRADGELIYDFGQNFAGVVRAKINGKKGQTVVFRHAEILKQDGSLFTELLRSAKATATYICQDGEQTYQPTMSYMGFRYVGVKGIEESDLQLTAVALYSDLTENGSFECSNELVNRYQNCILWSSKSNFVDIPTDCPQRDERMGWTGDINVFAATACYNYDMSRFLEKWLNDVRAEQLKTGGIPNTVPVQGYGFPATMPKMAIDFWGDACVQVPWAEYLARGDKQLLEKCYPMMKKYVNACRFWAGLLSFGKKKYIWHTPAILHFGDWIAPGVEKMSDWQKRSKWTATASLNYTSGLVSKIAGILGKKEDERKYRELSEKVADAYVSVFTDGKGKLKEEFQTAYVLPLQFKMFPQEIQPIAAENLAKLVKSNGYCIGTGFPGTPYILFALADNGQEEAAYKMLMNTDCPSWLYEVKAGGTTVWERWDALKEDGSSNTGAEDGTGGMISFNHYASGAVGDFFYRRIAGIEPIEGGYKRFKIQPLPGGGLTSAKGEVFCPYGKIRSDWRIENNTFEIDVEVPVGTECELILPNGEKQILGSGTYSFVA